MKIVGLPLIEVTNGDYCNWSRISIFLSPCAWQQHASGMHHVSKTTCLVYPLTCLIKNVPHYGDALQLLTDVWGKSDLTPSGIRIHTQTQITHTDTCTHTAVRDKLKLINTHVKCAIRDWHKEGVAYLWRWASATTFQIKGYKVIFVLAVWNWLALNITTHNEGKMWLNPNVPFTPKP